MKELTDESSMTLCLPNSYLKWVYDQEWCKGALAKYIEDNQDVITKNDHLK